MNTAQHYTSYRLSSNCIPPCFSPRQGGNVCNFRGWRDFDIFGVVPICAVDVVGLTLSLRNERAEGGWDKFRMETEELIWLDLPPTPLPSLAMPMSTRLSTSGPTSARNDARSLVWKFG
jgi:hypothetical protein